MSRTPMKLILTQEVTGLGSPGDVVEVAAGYGRNYLIPRGFAIAWTRGGEKQVEQIKRARAGRRRPAGEADCPAEEEGRHERPPLRLGWPVRDRGRGEGRGRPGRRQAQ